MVPRRSLFVTLSQTCGQTHWGFGVNGRCHSRAFCWIVVVIGNDDFGEDCVRPMTAK